MTVRFSLTAGADSTLQLLRRLGQPVAPHVAMRLSAALAGDGAAIAQVAASLTASQRAGRTALPDPLPVVPAVVEAMATTLDALAARSRHLLLCTAVSLDRRADVVLAATGLTVSDVLSGDAAPHLTAAAGRLAFTDPRVRVHIHGTATLGERTAAHAALADAYRATGDERLAVWHTSLSTLEGDPALVEPLLELSAAARRAGAAEWAHSVAREAASRAGGALQLRAHLAAGEAALDAGLVEDAVIWLRGPSAGPDDIAVRALPAFAVALTLCEGNVPDGDLARHVVRATSPGAGAEIAGAVAPALGVAAALHAERGHDGEARDLLAIAQRLSGPRRDRLALARAWCALFEVDTGMSPSPIRPAGHVRAGHPDAILDRVVRALELARDDSHEPALGVLQGGAGAPMGAAAPWFGDLTRSHAGPLVEAHRRVAIALVEFWAGDLTRARRGLSDAALIAPVGLPFAGLGVALARRLDVCTDGSSLPTSLGLEDTHPTPTARALRGGVLVDRAIAAYLGGRVTEAATLLSLAGDAAPHPTSYGLPLPGLDETSVWAVAGRLDEARAAASRLAQAIQHRSTLQRAAVLARTRLVTAASAEEAADAARAAAEACRALPSPYERARTEMLLGRARAAQGDLESARSHLLAASGLFDAAGAAVWRAACDADLELLPAESRMSVLTAPTPIIPGPSAGSAPAPSTTQAATLPVRAAHADDPESLEPACRQTWADVLTERELDVAMLVSQGHSNREVAARLFVSVRTVEVHLGRIFTKLGVPSRVALSVLAHRIARERAAVGAARE